MSRFIDWFTEVGPQILAGVADGKVPPLGSKSLEGLRKSLRTRMRKNEIYFRIAFSLTILLAIATLVAAFLPMSKGTAWVPAAFGISTAGAIAMAMNAVRDKQSFDMMLELAVGLDDDAVREVLNVLLKKYAESGSTQRPGRSIPSRRATAKRG